MARGYTFADEKGATPEAASDRAYRLNALAERVAAGDVPRAVLEQRANLLRRRGGDSRGRSRAERAKVAPLRTSRDYYLSGTEALSAGRFPEARTLFARAVELDPGYYWAHMGLGMAYDGLGITRRLLGVTPPQSLCDQTLPSLTATVATSWRVWESISEPEWTSTERRR